MKLNHNTNYTTVIYCREKCVKKQSSISAAYVTFSTRFVMTCNSKIHNVVCNSYKHNRGKMNCLLKISFICLSIKLKLVDEVDIVT